MTTVLEDAVRPKAAASLLPTRARPWGDEGPSGRSSSRATGGLNVIACGWVGTGRDWGEKKVPAGAPTAAGAEDVEIVDYH